MSVKDETYDMVVAGGGLAGLCAAVAGARHGLEVCLVQDRPVLGGVASSEVGVTVHGAACFHPYGRETGLISELLIEERAHNHEPIRECGWVNSVFDLVLYDLAERTDGLTVYLNTALEDVWLQGGHSGLAEAGARPSPSQEKGYLERPACAPAKRIESVTVSTANAERRRTLRASWFVDATGDGTLAHLAGCAWRMGCESRDEEKEIHAPAKASTDTMGSTLLIRARDIGTAAPFVPPPWAVRYRDASFFYGQGRRPTDPAGGYWWIEIGVPWHTIHDNEEIRRELTRHALGVWDWMKNRDPEMKERCRTYVLDWIGQVPGKRDSRRILGRYWMTENDIQSRTAFPDEVAYGGWFIDLHSAGGLLADSSEPVTARDKAVGDEYELTSNVGPYGIPLRSLMARDVNNLFLAGRCLSATHAALGTLRVMGTTALMGQAVGTSAAVAQARGLSLPKLAADAGKGGPAICRIQQQLLRDGCFLPTVSHADGADLARRAKATASSEALMHGCSPADARHTNGQGFYSIARVALETPRGQVLFPGPSQLRSIQVLLDNDTDGPLAVPVRLRQIRDIWDYRPTGGGVLAEGALQVPPGRDQWVAWDLQEAHLRVSKPICARLELGPAEGAWWRTVTAPAPGHVSHYAHDGARLRGRPYGFGFRIDPPQPCFGACQVINGRTRPLAAANLWRSDPGRGLPQWLQLEWPEPAEIRTVELIFPGHLLTEVHAEPPFFRDPQTPREWRLLVDRGERDWRQAAAVRDNYQRRAVHTLDPAVKTRRIRVLVIATNGDPCAALYEVRCYGPS